MSAQKNIRDFIPREVMSIASSTPFDIYIVGGFVRDFLTGKTPYDIDLAGEPPASELGLNESFKIKTVNKRLNTATISLNNSQFEYTPFRIESYPPNGEHTPSQVAFNVKIRQDAARRDFTVNAVYYDIKRDKFIDFYGGIEDAKNHILRELGGENVFSRDGLRLLRLVRIALGGFNIDEQTLLNAKNNASLLKDISKERIAVELKRVLDHDECYTGLKLMAKLQLFPYIIPEVAFLEGLAQPEQYHKFDAMEHTFLTVKYAPKRVRLAALMHDVGKAISVKERGNMHGHESDSESAVYRALGENGLKLSTGEITHTARLVKNHMYDGNGRARESKVRVFIAKNHDILDDLVALIKADSLATGVIKPIQTHRFELVRQKMIEEGAPFSVRDLKIDGNDARELGIEPKKIGGVLEDLLHNCIYEPRLNQREWLLTTLKNIAERNKKNKK